MRLWTFFFSPLRPTELCAKLARFPVLQAYFGLRPLVFAHLLSLFAVISMLSLRVSFRFKPSFGRLLLQAALLLGSLGSGGVWARSVAASAHEIALEALPKQGQVVYAQIHQGGPFAFAKDGSVFANYERILPRQQRAYYREYTVTYNAASRTRGPRRIVCGGQRPSQPEACYYSPDHYKSFLRITPSVPRPSERLQQLQRATP